MFTQDLPIHKAGGAQNHTELLSEQLARRGHTVTIITAPLRSRPAEEKKENLEIYYLRNKPRFTREMFFRESARLFADLNKKRPFDVIHSQQELAGGYAKYCRHTLPLVMTFHGSPLNEIKTALGERHFKSCLNIPFWLKYHLLDYPAILKRTDKIITVSRELKEDVKKQYNLAEEKLVVIPSSVDLSRFADDLPENIENIKEKFGVRDEKIILSIGRMEKQKGFHLLLKILPRLITRKEKIRLILVGSGPYLKKLKKTAGSMNISEHVIFTGKCSQEDIAAYYKLADLVVLPTLRLEGLPLVHVEAAACGKPVISSRIGGIPTLIGDYNEGFLVEPGDLFALEQKIHELLDNDFLARRLGENARKKVIEGFNADRMVEDTLNVYREAVARVRSNAANSAPSER